MTINIDEWLAKFEKNKTVVIRVSKEFLHDAATVFYDIVQDRTPVGDPSLWKYPAHKDYVPGSLRAAWQLDSFSDREVVHNDLPYAQRVEYGWSTQAPQGMMRLTIKDFPSIIKGLKIGRD